MDAQNLAQAIADPDGEGMDDHWVSTSYEFLTGLILHVKYYERDKSLTGVSTYMADPSFEDPEQMFLRMLQAEHDPDGSMGWLDSGGNQRRLIRRLRFPHAQCSTRKRRSVIAFFRRQRQS